MVGWDIVGQCRAGGEGAWPPRAERGVKGQHAPALHCIYNPPRILPYYPTPCTLGALLRSGVPWSLCSRVMTMSLSRPAHSPHLYLVNWPGTASAKVLMTNNLPSPVGPGMLADPGPEGSLSSLVLVRPPRCLLLDFWSREFNYG